MTKQGMIYRSARFSENGTGKAIITKKGCDIMLNDLKIKSEVDLRLTSNNETGGITKSVIDDSLNYYSVPMSYLDNPMTDNAGEMKNLFDILSNINNYPLVFHCSIGTDRTGLVAMILNNLLEVKREHIYQDYLFSNFALIGGSRSPSTITSYYDFFAQYEGNTVKEQTISYLKSNNVEQSKIDSFIKIMK